METVVFDKDSAKLIAEATRRTLGMPYGEVGKRKGHRMPGSNVSDYDGPFAVIDSSYVDDTDPDNPVSVAQITVCGYYEPEGRLLYAVMNLGLEWVEFEETDLIITNGGYPFIKITNTNNVYETEVVVLEDLPTQTNTEFYWLLPYYVNFANGVITSIEEARNIMLPGRLF